MVDVKKEFDDKIAVPMEVEKEIQNNEDDKLARPILSSEQTVSVDGIGRIIFKWPKTGLVMQAESIVARYKALHLRKGDILTQDQLKAIYCRSTKITNSDGIEEVLEGPWTEKQANRLEELPKVLNEKALVFDEYRNQLKELKLQLETLKGSEQEPSKQDEYDARYQDAFNLYIDITNDRLELVDLQTKHYELFCGSLEELANFEKIKLFAPHCIFKIDNTPLWKSEAEMEQCDFNGVKVISLFSLFLRGVDVSFFDVTAGGVIT